MNHVRLYFKAAYFQLEPEAQRVINCTYQRNSPSKPNINHKLHASEIPMEDTAAYRSAFDRNPCYTSCAIEPSATFKSVHSCAPSDDVACICGNVTASLELKTSMWNYCKEHCDAATGPYSATAILAEYCSVNQHVAITR